METSILTSKGQVVIPEKIRKKFGIKPGTRIAFIEKDGEILLRAITRDYFRNLAGWLKGSGDILNELKKEKKREIGYDEKRSV
ncbi:MAG: AbrB/MazE/SpoVT family DNA-binding domain-containing protein [Cyclobacteriaceae bacterium]|nr:AbrB/MazE/SpoVT family DNA-binding domain-containing protein [Cyclobacteriaceae bacterium]